MRLFTISILVFFSSAVFSQNFDWTLQNSGVTTSLNDVFFANNQTGWAVGDGGIILNTTDGGQNWLPQASGVTEKLRAVFFINDTTGYAVGGVISKAMLKTTDGGANWQSIAASNISPNSMYDIAFFDANTGWLVSYDSIFMTSDGGNTWVNEGYTTAVGSPQNRAIAVTSDTTAFVGGSRKDGVSSRGADVFYRRPNNTPYFWDISGMNTPVSGDDFYSIGFSNSHIGFAGGTKGKLLRKAGVLPTDNWNLNFNLNENLVIYSISFPNENNGMFSVSKVISGTNYTLVYHTIDGGDNWSANPDSIPTFLIGVVHAPDTANAWAVGVDGKIYKGEMKTTGIRRMESDFDINIYPNPTTDLISIEIKSEKNELITYTLLDISGRLIKNGKWNLNSPGSRFTLDLSDISKGTYLLKLNTEKGQAVHRILKN